MTNVNAHSLGVEGIDPETLRKTNVMLIPRNTPLPAKFTERFVTKSEGQRSIVVQVLEGREFAAGRVHGHRADGDPRPARRTAQGLAGRGHLRVRHQRAAERPGGGAGHAPRGRRLTLERDVGLSDEGIARWKTAGRGSPPGSTPSSRWSQDVLGLGRPHDRSRGGRSARRQCGRAAVAASRGRRQPVAPQPAAAGAVRRSAAAADRSRRPAAAAAADRSRRPAAAGPPSGDDPAADAARSGGQCRSRAARSPRRAAPACARLGGLAVDARCVELRPRRAAGRPGAGLPGAALVSPRSSPALVRYR